MFGLNLSGVILFCGLCREEFDTGKLIYIPSDKFYFLYILKVFLELPVFLSLGFLVKASFGFPVLFPSVFLVLIILGFLGLFPLRFRVKLPFGLLVKFSFGILVGPCSL